MEETLEDEDDEVIIVGGTRKEVCCTVTSSRDHWKDFTNPFPAIKSSPKGDRIKILLLTISYFSP